MDEISENIILECSQSVLNFLIKDSDGIKDGIISLVFLPHYEDAFRVIEKYKMGDLTSFTKYLNKRYKIMREPIWKYTARDFFSTDTSKDFYKVIIRDLKLKKLVD